MHKLHSKFNVFFWQTEDTLKFFVTLEDLIPTETGSFGKVRNNFVKVAISVIILDDNDNTPRFINVSYVHNYLTSPVYNLKFIFHIFKNKNFTKLFKYFVYCL